MAYRWKGGSKTYYQGVDESGAYPFPEGHRDSSVSATSVATAPVLNYWVLVAQFPLPFLAGGY